MNSNILTHSTHRVPECLSLRRNWVPHPFPRERVGEGMGDWTESLILCILCFTHIILYWCDSSIYYISQNLHYYSSFEHLKGISMLMIWSFFCVCMGNNDLLLSRECGAGWESNPGCHTAGRRAKHWASPRPLFFSLIRCTLNWATPHRDWTMYNAPYWDTAHPPIEIRHTLNWATPLPEQIIWATSFFFHIWTK